MKHWTSILLVMLLSVALLQLYRAHVELECACEVLSFEVKGVGDMLKGTTRYFSERTRQDAQKIADLEAKLKVLTAGKTQSTDNGSASAARSETFRRLPEVANTGSSDSQTN